MDFCKNIFFKWQNLGPIVDQYPCNLKEKITNLKIAQDKNNKTQGVSKYCNVKPKFHIKIKSISFTFQSRYS